MSLEKSVPIEVVFDIVDGGSVRLDMNRVEWTRLWTRMQTRMLQRRMASAGGHLLQAEGKEEVEEVEEEAEAEVEVEEKKNKGQREEGEEEEGKS